MQHFMTLSATFHFVGGLRHPLQRSLATHFCPFDVTFVVRHTQSINWPSSSCSGFPPPDASLLLSAPLAVLCAHVLSQAGDGVLFQLRNLQLCCRYAVFQGFHFGGDRRIVPGNRVWGRQSLRFTAQNKGSRLWFSFI